MALVCGEMDTGKLFERSLSSSWAGIKPHFTRRVKDEPSPPYAHRDFDELRLDWPEIREIVPSPRHSKLIPDGLGFQ